MAKIISTQTLLLEILIRHDAWPSKRYIAGHQWLFQLLVNTEYNNIQGEEVGRREWVGAARGRRSGRSNRKKWERGGRSKREKEWEQQGDEVGKGVGGTKGSRRSGRSKREKEWEEQEGQKEWEEQEEGVGGASGWSGKRSGRDNREQKEWEEQKGKTTEGAELSRSRRAATAEVLSCTTSTEITTLASNISAYQLQTGNFGFQDTVYFATWIPSSADLQSTLWFIDDIALINSSSTPSTTHPNCIWQPCF